MNTLLQKCFVRSNRIHPEFPNCQQRGLFFALGLSGVDHTPENRTKGLELAQFFVAESNRSKR